MSIQEIKLGLNLEQGQASFRTLPIKGKLNSLIIDTTNKIELIIESNLGYLIYHRKEIYGPDYIAPRVRVSTPISHYLDALSFDKFVLNEELIITAIGPKGTEVALVMRIEED